MKNNFNCSRFTIGKQRQFAVNGKELWVFSKTNKTFTDWLADGLKNFIEGWDFIVEKHSGFVDYFFTVDAAEKLVRQTKTENANNLLSELDEIKRTYCRSAEKQSATYEENIEMSIPKFAAYRSIGSKKDERYGLGIIDKHSKGFDFRNRKPGSHMIVLLLQGQGFFYDHSGHEYPLQPGAVCQLFAGDRSTIQMNSDKGWLECFIELGCSMTEILEQYGCISRLTPVHHIAVNNALIKKLLKIREILQAETNEAQIGNWLEIMNTVRELLTNNALTERDIERNNLIREARVYLATNLDQPDKLNDFCRKHSMGYENFRKIFKQKTGISPHHYRIRCRLDAACTMLANSELTIAEISQKLGYNSPYEFSAQFGHWVGVPPTTYRR